MDPRGFSPLAPFIKKGGFKPDTCQRTPGRWDGARSVSFPGARPAMCRRIASHYHCRGHNKELSRWTPFDVSKYDLILPSGNLT